MEKGKMSNKCEGDRNDGNEHGGAQPKETRHLGRKRIRYTGAQVKVMEEMFSGRPHLDEKERKELSIKLGLTPQQIKFWFQNRRTQVKVQQERTDNALLRTEIERLRLDNEALQQTLRDFKCPTCGGPNVMADMLYDKHRLSVENALLKEEIGKLSEVASNCFGRTIPLLEARAEQSQLISSLHDHGTGSSGQNQITWPLPTFVSMDKSSALEAAIKATEELIWMMEKGEPVWVQKPAANGTIEILNADEFCRSFPRGTGLSSNTKREGSRDSSVVPITGDALVDVFMDANKWKEMFSLIVTRAQTLQVVCPGVDGHRNGLLQQMYAELQVMSPFIPTRKISFLRFSQHPSDGLWVVVDFTPESLDYNAPAFVGWYRKHPSGCVIQEAYNGCSRVTWIEQGEIEDRMVYEMYEQRLINSGMTFGAQCWLACLQRQCAWFKILVDLASQGANTVLQRNQRRNMIRLAQKVTSNFFSSITALSATPESSSDDIKITTRKASEVGSSRGVVICVGTSVKLSVSPQMLFDFLGDDQTRSQCNILSCGEWEKGLTITNGFGPANSISLFKVTTEGMTEMVLKQSYTDASGSVVVYAAINVDALDSEDASSLPVAAPYGFTILPYDTTPVRNSLIPTSLLHKAASTSSRYSEGSLFTLVFQATETRFSTCDLSAEYVASIHNVINKNIERIKTLFGCTDD